MRIALLTSFFPPLETSGIARYVEDLALGLSNRGHDVEVFAVDPEKRTREKKCHFTVNWVQRHSFNLIKVFPSFSSLITSFRLFNALNIQHCKKPFDIIEYPNDGITAIFALLRDLKNPQPLFITRLSSPKFVFPKSSVLPRLTDKLESWQTNHSDAIISNTKANLKLCNESYRIPHELPKTVIYHSIAPGKPIQSQTTKRKDIIQILFVGRGEKRKGFDTLAKAWPIVLNAIPNAKLIVIGKDLPYNKNISFFNWAIKDLSSSCSISIEFIGTVSSQHRDALYQACHLCVVPSRYESFGLVSLEAMRFGTPVVGCEVGGIPEVVTHNKTGLLVPPDDPKSLAEATITLIRDENLRKQLGNTALQNIRKIFSPHRFIFQTELFYNKLINEQKSRAKY